MSKRSDKVHRRKTRKKRQARKGPSWTPFQEVEPESLIARQSEMKEYDAVVMTGIRMFVNNRYQVLVCGVNTAVGPLIQLSICNLDSTARHDWRDFQRIKNELLGPEIEGVELYPAESRLVDISNQFYMYCLPPMMIDGRMVNKRWPFGFQERLVSDQSYRGANRQRPWPKGERPEDARTISEEMVRDCLNALRDEHKARQAAVATTPADGNPRQLADHQEGQPDREDEPGGKVQAETGRHGDHNVPDGTEE